VAVSPTSSNEFCVILCDPASGSGPISILR
jgi:hypothetical protein